MMTGSANPHIQAAMQHLIWALEEIEKTGSKKAAQHVRSALNALRQGIPPTNLRDDS
ncbi:hypothetical protein JQ607_13690 [Bradyrhizobium liaoningense]|uniref:hypothetical protein n=1 Tax=Bradyrhizobium liaoningense TaxID=43992 RepID=UPI001BAAC2D9|nr:hypothetical protein [Bradyrhizobium liaoningense]MBR0841245.1 hypothetical protein [Bradyrhizobium liaoningense]